jgi:hypothetical protein
MVWSTTMVVEEFLAEAGEFLRAEPARNSVVLTVTENLRVKAACAQPAAQLSTQAAAELDTAGRIVLGVNAEEESAEAFAAAWRHRTGARAAVHRRMRLFRLGELVWPDPPDGSARRAAEPDRDLLIEWLDAFAREVATRPGRITALPPMTGSAPAP